MSINFVGLFETVSLRGNLYQNETQKFLSQIGTTLAAAALAPNLISCVRKQAQKIRGLKNWAGNYTYPAD